MRLKTLWFIVLFLVSSLVHATCIGLGCTCTASATPVAFGTYNPISGVALNNTGNIAVTCSALLVGLNVSYDIALNAGQNGTFAARAMKNLTSLLQYNLYNTAARTTIWGDGTAGTVKVSDGYLLNLLSVTRNYTVYGTLPASQNVPPATTYSDLITVTVTY